MKWAPRNDCTHTNAPDRMRRGLLRAALAVVLGLAAAPVWSDPPRRAAGAIPWSALNRDDQRLLGSHRAHWDRYPPEQQQRLLQGARRYMNLDPHTRQEIQRKREELEHMDAAKRKQLREKYEKKHKKDR